MIQPAKEGRIRATLKDARGSAQLGKGGHVSQAEWNASGITYLGFKRTFLNHFPLA